MEKRIVLLTLLLSACVSLDLAEDEQEIHAWGNFHWPEDNHKITFFDATIDSRIDDALIRALCDWDDLGTPLSLHPGKEGADILIVEDEELGSLGLAELTLKNKDEIASAKVTINPVLYQSSTYSYNALRHVICQEVGHALGLYHIQADSCMDDCGMSFDWYSCINSPNNIGPNAHDREQLNLIYGE